MPRHDFKCPDCGFREDDVFWNVRTPKTCPLCGTWMRQVWNSPAVPVFKGSGFYNTDSRPRA